MPLRVYLNAERSPYYRIRGNVLGERIDRSSGLAGKKEAQALADRIAAEIRQRRIAGEPDKPKELTFAQAAVNYLLEPVLPQFEFGGCTSGDTKHLAPPVVSVQK